MRYLIIDIKKLHAQENEITDPKSLFIFRKWLNKIIKPNVLSEEESLGKFKEIYDAGNPFPDNPYNNSQAHYKWIELEDKL